MKRKSSKWPKWFSTFPSKKILPATEKIAYTTLGILLALWINNCDERRKNRDTEHKTLLELRAGLEQDRHDVLETIEGYSYRIYNIEQIFNFLGRETLPPDSLASRMSDLIGYSFLLANTAAYETLKSRGLETVTNDTLRLNISTLYDVDYEAIQVLENHLNEIYNTMLLPYLVSEMRLGAKAYSPAEIVRLRNDRAFQQMLWQVKLLNQSVLERYQQTLVRIENLLQDIGRSVDGQRLNAS